MAARVGAPARPSPVEASAQRFAARVRSRRRRRWAAVVAVVALVVAAGWVVLRSQWLSVQTVTVDGLQRVAPQTVRMVTDAELGRPMVLVDPTALAQRLVRVPLVKSAVVERSWPSTVVVHVHERQPVAVVPAPGGGNRLVDEDGVTVGPLTGSSDLPLLQVDVEKAGAPTLRAALAVLDGLPPALSAQVSSIGGDTQDGVWLVLDDGTRVVWGSAESTQAKASVLTALVRSGTKGRGTTIDVSSPDAPAVSSRR